MSSTADVRSMAQMQVLREKCERTRVNLLRELENLQLEMRKIASWIEDGAQAYWQDELKTANRVWREAKESLARCESYVRESEKRPCTEQRKHLAKATERQSLCERQVRLAREANLVWHREATKLQAKLQRVMDLAESELPVAVNRLEGLLIALEAYANVHVPRTEAN